MGSNLTGTWTEEKVEELKQLWNQGLSAAEIATALGFETRGPVCGKINRLGLSGQRKPKKENEALPEPTPEPATDGSRHLTILELRAMECRWADADRNKDGLHTFCGRLTPDGASYCAKHAALSRGTGTVSERAAVNFLRKAAA